MQEKYSRLSQLEEVEAKISELKAQLIGLEAERKSLVSEISEDTVLNQLPARAKNPLIRYGIDSDLKLSYFLLGDSQFVDSTRAGFSKNIYFSSTTSLGRLMSLPNIGVGTAQVIIQILEQNKFF